ncbi:MAG: cytochrome P450 [Sandaracinaceae bacterium]
MLADLADRTSTALRARGPFGSLPKGPPEPAGVQTAMWIARPTRYLLRASHRYGDVFTMRLIATDPFVSFAHPDAIREIFTGPGDELYAGQANIILEPILGQHSVLLLDGARHMRQRRLLLPPFHGQRMRAYGETIRDATIASMDSWPRGAPFALHERTQEITLEVIQRAVFGIDGADDLRRFGAALSSLLDTIANPLLMLPVFQVDFGRYSPGGILDHRLAELDDLLFAQIRRRRREPRDGREDILSALIDARDEAGESMSDQELRDELMTLLVAGHETTATSIAWAFHRLLDHPEALARAVEEVDATFGDGPIDPDRVRELRWIDAVIKETLRLSPVIPMVGRRLQSPMTFGATRLPAGVIAVPNIYLAHRHPDVWPDPLRFDPSRFLEQKPNPYAYFPFGGGIRRCIGMAFAMYEMAVVMAAILQRFRVEAAPGVKVRLVRRSITFSPSEGMPMVVHPRR